MSTSDTELPSHLCWVSRLPHPLFCEFFHVSEGLNGGTNDARTRRVRDVAMVDASSAAFHQHSLDFRPRRSFTRVFHTPPQHFTLPNSIPTAAPPISLPTRLAPLHSLNNATVCRTLRGASRLGRRRKGSTESSRRAASGFAVTQTLPPATARAIAADGGAESPAPALSALPLGNRVAVQETEGEPGASLRERTKVRGVHLSSACIRSGIRALRLQSAAQAPRFPQRRRERVTTRSNCTSLQARRGGWLLRA
jgi:hypothetical protein